MSNSSIVSEGGEAVPPMMRMETVKTPHPTDILSGKGRVCLNHDGSRRFRCIIETYSLRYQQAGSRQEKMEITKEIFERLKTSRFLKYNESTEMWETLKTTEIKDKIGHALRFSNRKTNRRGPGKSGAVGAKSPVPSMACTSDSSNTTSRSSSLTNLNKSAELQMEMPGLPSTISTTSGPSAPSSFASFSKRNSIVGEFCESSVDPFTPRTMDNLFADVGKTDAIFQQAMAFDSKRPELPDLNSSEGLNNGLFNNSGVQQQQQQQQLLLNLQAQQQQNNLASNLTILQQMQQNNSGFTGNSQPQTQASQGSSNSNSGMLNVEANQAIISRLLQQQQLLETTLQQTGLAGLVGAGNGSNNGIRFSNANPNDNSELLSLLQLPMDLAGNGNGSGNIINALSSLSSASPNPSSIA